MTLVMTPLALERQGKLAFQGYGYKMFLVNDSEATLTEASDATAWEALEVSGNGYTAFTGVVANGSFNAGTGRWEHPLIEWSFTGTLTGYTFTHRCLLLSRAEAFAIATGAIASNVATIETTVAHPFEVGDEIVIAGATGGFNGTHTVASTPAADSFTFALTAANATSAAIGGTATRFTPEPKLEGIDAYDPEVSLAGGQELTGTLRLVMAP
jgi:hypothetical protein